jgi:hypothetical protein
MILMMLIVVYYNTATVIDREFQEERLRLAVDYAAEAAFQTSLTVEDLGMEYLDMSNVTVNPGNCLDIFKSVLCLNYNMSASEENLAHLDNYIPTGVLCGNNGYYILTMSEDDTTPTNGVKGGEYCLRWSVKKPYTVRIGNTYYAVDIRRGSWVSVRDNGGNLEVSEGTSLPYGIDKDGVLRLVNTRIAQDMLYEIQRRNFNKEAWEYKFYLPPVQTTSGVNPITGPSLLIFVEGVDFASPVKVDAVSVAGFKTIRKKVVIGYKDPSTGRKYYAYEGQLPSSLLLYADNYYNDVEDAAKAGYAPNYDFIQKKVNYDE